MNKKPGLLLAVSVFAMIVLASAFKMQLGGGNAVHLRAGVNPGDVLYVCPVSGDGWNTFANSFHLFSKYVYLLFIFAFIVLLFGWGWALYQNLLKDKFSADVYKNPWGLTKLLFWAGVIVTVLMVTPNHFRKVYVRYHGNNHEYVLCESNSVGARAVNERTVTAR